MGALAFISTAWGPRFGGINSFNQDLCQAVAAAAGPAASVVCFTFAPTLRDIDQAMEAGVRLIALEGNAGSGSIEISRAYEIVHTAKELGPVDWWIGHDVISGPVAVRAAKLDGTRVAVIQHTDYASYASLKGTSGEIIIARDRAETTTLLEADVVCAVGPKLAAAALDRIRQAGTAARVTELVPGLPDIRTLQTAPATFRAITFGRLGPESDRIKQGRLAVHAFARLVRELPEVVGDDPRISAIGVNSPRGSNSDGEQEELSRLAAEHAGRSVSVVGHPFTEDREVLFHALSDASACLMLSVHEGFGLTGWEAIAAGVPLLLSRNSGLYRLLKGVGDPALGCVRAVDVRGRPESPYYREEDVADVTKALRQIALDPGRAKSSALTLRSMLSAYTWERTAATLLEALGRSTRESISVDPTGTAHATPGDVLPTNNVPATDDAFIGRGDDLDRLRATLVRPHTRLVTLVGTAGTGKTRLAQEVAWQLLADFDDHVYFVDLSAVADPTLVIASITRALHVEARDPVLDALKELFRSRKALLVLDNFEQVLDAALILRELLAEAPGLRILATSREPMRVTGEVQFDLSPLTADAAVQLFTERAASNSTTYADDQRSVEELCVKLDNLPLAIELVAARARLFSPERLLQLVNGSLLDLAAKRRDVPDKQRSLRAAIDWSYQLLTPAEQRLFRRLSVFAGGWTITDAWQVLTRQEITELRFAHELDALLDKRLVRVATDGTRRFDMLETLREYARECLDAEPAEADTVRHAHAEYWLAAAEAAHPDPLSRRQTAGLRILEQEQDNLNAALVRLIDTHDAASALRMAAACGRSWWSRDCAGGLARISDVLCLPNLDSAVRQRAVVLLWRGRLAIRLGRLRPAERDITECLALAEHWADPELEASAAADSALVQMERCEWDEAAALLLRARELYEQHPHWTGLADLIDNLGVLATGRGDFAAALQLLTESHQLYDRDADEAGAAWVDNDLARVYLALGDTAAAGRLATSAYQSGLRQGDPQLVCWARNYLGLAASSRGLYEESLEHHSESLAAAMLLSDHRPEALALEGFAALRSNEGRHEEAVTLAAAANAHRRRYELPRTAADRSILEARLARSQAALGPSLVSTLTAAGDALTLEQAAILARRG